VGKSRQSYGFGQVTLLGFRCYGFDAFAGLVFRDVTVEEGSMLRT
jgi:hypothetical protein